MGVIMSRADLFLCWRSGQIEPSEMLELCREDAELRAMLSPEATLERKVEE